MLLDTPLLIVFPLAMAFGGIMDLLTMTIPNRVSIVLGLGFVAVAVLIGMNPWTFAAHMAVGIAVLGIAIALFAHGFLGGGDAKLLAAASLWLGHNHLLEYLAMVSILGGVLAVLILLYRRFPIPSWLLKQDWALRLHDRKTGVPYGVALAGAALWAFPSTAIFQSIVA